MTALLKKSKPQTIAIVVIVLFIVGYAFFRSENLIKGPNIKVSSPSTGATVESESVTVNGQAERIATLFMNGRQVFTDDKGNFSESLLLAYGYNIIELKAKDKFGRATSRTLELVFK